jgi:hypothetical protein
VTKAVRVGNRDQKAIPAFADTSFAHAEIRARLPTLRRSVFKVWRRTEKAMGN